jgi:hypothetical protein
MTAVMGRTITGPGWSLTPVMDSTGEPQLFDIYFADKWIGSRRTEKQCYDAIRQLGGKAPAAENPPRFIDVPPEIRDCVLRTPDIASKELFFRDLFAAHCVTWWYLRKGLLPGQARRVLNLKESEISGLSPVHYSHLLLLGQSLFEMRSHPGFPEFCRRLKDRDLISQSVAFELIATERFCRSGFYLHARPEVGIKKEDFDFTAVRESVSINVEVTALTTDSFKENTVMNALNQKRQQLPADKPAIIFCNFPESWAGEGIDLNSALMRLANQFLRGTQRINAIVFQTFKQYQRGEAGGLALIENAYPNPKPRIHTDLDFLFKGGGVDSRQMDKAFEPSASNSTRDSAYATLRTGEFHRWVDSMFV